MRSMPSQPESIEVWIRVKNSDGSTLEYCWPNISLREHSDGVMVEVDAPETDHWPFSAFSRPDRHPTTITIKGEALPDPDSADPHTSWVRLSNG